jgi:hypothetical protein
MSFWTGFLSIFRLNASKPCKREMDLNAPHLRHQKPLEVRQVLLRDFFFVSTAPQAHFRFSASVRNQRQDWKGPVAPSLYLRHIEPFLADCISKDKLRQKGASGFFLASVAL